MATLKKEMWHFEMCMGVNWEILKCAVSLKGEGGGIGTRDYGTAYVGGISCLIL